jgi:glutaryl-CoA dehydrogenase
MSWRPPTRQSCSCTASDELTETIAALATLSNTLKAREVLAEARNLLGGNGIVRENRVIGHMTGIEATYAFEATETIQTPLVGRVITGLSAFT